LSRADAAAESLGVGADLAAGGLLASLKSWFLITLIGGTDSRACFEALAAASTADGLTGFEFAGCGLAGSEALGCVPVDWGGLDCSPVWLEAKVAMSSHPTISRARRRRIYADHIAAQPFELKFCW